MILAALASAAAACPNPIEAVDRARSAWFGADAAGAQRALDEAEEGLQCVVIEPTDAARHLQVLGAVALGGGDAATAALALPAARLAAPVPWDDALGDDARALWTAPPPPGTATLNVPADVVVRVDGAPVGGGVMPAGLHLVQVLRGDTLVRGLVVAAQAGDTRSVDLGAAPPSPAPAAPRAEPAGPRGPWAPWLGGGVGASVGRGAEAGGSSEPGVLVTVPLEVGLSWTEAFWVRGAFTAAPSLTGPLLFSRSATPDDTTRWPLLVGAAVGGGGRVGALRLGGSLDVRLPGRWGVEAVAGRSWRRLVLEVRPGVQFATGGRSPEPGLAVLVGRS